MTELSKAEQELKEEIARIISPLDFVEGFGEPKLPLAKADQILALIKEALPELAKEAGYRLPAGKAPLLTDKQIARALEGTGKYSNWNLEDAIYKPDRAIAKAQNDADNKHFGVKL